MILSRVWKRFLLTYIARVQNLLHIHFGCFLEEHVHELAANIFFFIYNLANIILRHLKSHSNKIWIASNPHDGMFQVRAFRQSALEQFCHWQQCELPCDSAKLCGNKADAWPASGMVGSDLAEKKNIELDDSRVLDLKTNWTWTTQQTEFFSGLKVLRGLEVLGKPCSLFPQWNSPTIQTLPKWEDP